MPTMAKPTPEEVAEAAEWLLKEQARGIMFCKSPHGGLRVMNETGAAITVDTNWLARHEEAVLEALELPLSKLAFQRWRIKEDNIND